MGVFKALIEKILENPKEVLADLCLCQNGTSSDPEDVGLDMVGNLLVAWEEKLRENMSPEEAKNARLCAQELYLFALEKEHLGSLDGVSEFFTDVIGYTAFDSNGPAYKFMMEAVLSFTFEIPMSFVDYKDYGVHAYLDKNNVPVEDCMVEMPSHLTAGFLAIVRNLVGREFDEMFQLSAAYHFLCAVHEAYKTAENNNNVTPEMHDFYIGNVEVSECLDGDFAEKTFSMMHVPEDDENRKEYEALIKKLFR